MAPERSGRGRLARAPLRSLANTIATDTGWPARLTPHTAIVAQPPAAVPPKGTARRASCIPVTLHPPLLLVLTFDSAPPDRRGRSYCCCLYLDPRHLASDSSVHVLLACLRMRLPSPLYEYHPSLRWFVALPRACFRLFLCGGAPRFGLSPSSFFPSKFSGTVPAGSLSRIGRASPPYLMTSKRQQNTRRSIGEREACSSADDDEKTRETQLNDKIDIYS